MRTPLIAANWKMNGTGEHLSGLAQGIARGAESVGSVHTLLFAPHPYLARVVNDTRGTSTEVGAQDVAAEAPGAYTGEVAAEMIADVGCRWTLVGHSERRALYGDSDERVAMKVQRAVACGLRVMLCVGETRQERESGNTELVVLRQLDAVLKLCGVQPILDGALAYEPVWAIGTGLSATPEQANAVHAQIRGHLSGDGERVRIVYGGSVKSDNAAGLVAMPDIDGALVGGASLQVESFLGIIKAV